MQNNFLTHKYWFLIAITFIIAIFILYPYSTFQGVKMDVTMGEAKKAAQNFLKEQNISLKDYYTEAFVDDNPARSRYLLKILRNKEFKESVSKEKLPIYGWEMLFYKNLSKDMPQIIYRVGVSYSGKITHYSRIVPDTMFLPSLSRDSATKFISNYLKQTGGIDLSGYKLVETKEDNFSKRNDFSFLWEKQSKDIKGKLIVRAKVQGNEPGGFENQLEVPAEQRGVLNAGEAIFVTVSIIFIFFLSQFAVTIFLRKYHQGEIWIKIGLRLFWVFLAVSVVGIINDWPAFGNGVGIDNLSYLLVKIIAVLTTGLLLSFFLSMLLFVAWTVGESYARELWPNGLKSVDAFIKGRILSLPSGISLFKGMVIGTGLAVFYLALTVFVNSYHSDIIINVFSLLKIYSGFLPAVGVLTESFTIAALASIVLVFFIANISYQRWKRKWVSIFISGLVTTLGAIISSDTPSTGMLGLNLFINFIYGCLFAYIYFAFDLLTLTSTLFHSSLVVSMYMLASSNTAYYKFNFYLLAAVYILTPIVYVISMIKREDFVLESYGLPSHILRISERERLKKEMEIAAKMQLSLLPKEQPSVTGYDIAGTSIPAKEAGGDYYDFIKLAGSRLGIAIGDVSGKGVGAAIYMTLTKGIFQAHAEENVSPKHVLAKVNQLLYKTIEKNSFVSMIYSILDVDNNTMVYSRAGQNPGIFCSSDGGNTKSLTGNGIALGLDPGGIFNKVLIEEKVEMCPGDLVVFYTDGFTEAMNERREEYGEERLNCMIRDNHQKPAKEIISLILKDIKNFVDVYPQHDDMTIVIVKRN